MENNRHKGSELNNVQETWDANERKRNGDVQPRLEPAPEEASSNNQLDQIVKREAAAYDEEDKENTLLHGERASVNDDADD